MSYSNDAENEETEVETTDLETSDLTTDEIEELVDEPSEGANQ